MIPTAKNSSQLLTIIKDASLYENLINQLIKDFELSGFALKIDKTSSPQDLLKELQHQIYQLMLHNFEGFLQLLYRVDVSEHAMQSDKTQDIDEMTQKATYVILKREWQKVYFKNQFS